MAKRDADYEYESGAPSPSTKNKLRTEIMHKKCVTRYSRQDFKPSESQLTDNESRRGSPLQIIGNIVIEHDSNQMEDAIVEIATESNRSAGLSEDSQVPGVSRKTPPKTAAQRMREYRERQKLAQLRLLQQSSSQVNQRAGLSEDSQVPVVSTKKQRKPAAQCMREYRERKKLAILLQQQSNQDLDAKVSSSSPQVNQWAGLSEDSQVPGASIKKQRKTAAQCMREYRERKKLAILLQQQSNQDLDAKVSSSSPQVNQRAGLSEESQVPGASIKKQRKTAAQCMREYRERKKLAILLQQQSNQDLDAKVSSSSPQVNQRAGLSEESQVPGASIKKQRKTAAQCMREYRERKKLAQLRLLQQSSSQVNQRAGLSEESQVPGVSTKKQRKTAAQCMREYRERKKLAQLRLLQQSSSQVNQRAGLSEENQVPGVLTKKQRKTAAQCMREYRERKKLAILLQQQSNQDLDAKVSSSSPQVNQWAGLSEDSQVPGVSTKKQRKTAAQCMREYRQRKKLAQLRLLQQQSNQDLDAKVSTSSPQMQDDVTNYMIYNSFREEVGKREREEIVKKCLDADVLVKIEPNEYPDSDENAKEEQFTMDIKVEPYDFS